MKRHLLAIDQGTTGSTVLVMDLEGRTIGRATREFPATFPPAGVGRARTGGDLGERAFGRSWRVCRRPRSAVGFGAPPSGSPTSARRRSSGIARPESPSTERSSGRTGAPRTAVPSSRREGTSRCVREQTGLVHRPLFLGDEARLDPRQRRAGARARAEKGELAFGTVDTFLVSRLTGGAVARDRRHQRVAHAAHGSRDARVGRRDVRALRRAARGAPEDRGLGRRRSRARRGRRGILPTGSRSPGSPAISRRRSSARRASRTATRSAPTAPARSCS